MKNTVNEVRAVISYKCSPRDTDQGPATICLLSSKCSCSSEFAHKLVSSPQSKLVFNCKLVVFFF
ncbi:hypothetical protein ACJIZ3_005106 [Penstemon smallii]|uniref:Uncharacterized protein n=1 Tax=Penstemon smallii TaxID=265156 RepID=A0ABD3S3X9_9LAMI